MFEKNNLPPSSTLIMEASDSTETSTGLNGIASQRRQSSFTAIFQLQRGAHEWIEAGASLLYWLNS